MEIRFLGPLGKVTGSCTWMRDQQRNWNFIVDCGMQQGERSSGEWNNGCWPFDPRTLQFVVLTHAHIDHSGMIPLLYQRGFTGPVYCARETAEIATILLKDAARLSSGRFSEADVDAIRWKQPGREPFLGKPNPVATDLFLRFYRSSHVVGATSVAVYWGPKDDRQRKIIFSGDLGTNLEDRESMPYLRHVMRGAACDFAVLESTYGGKIRDAGITDARCRHDQLRELLDRTLAEQGTLILPAFSLGRTQDVVFDLHWIVANDPDRYGNIDFILDSPTAQKIAPIVLKALQRTESNGQGKVRHLWLGKHMYQWFGLDDGIPEDIHRLLEICRLSLCGSVDQESTRSDHGNVIARSWRPIFRAMEKGEIRKLAPTSKATVLVVSSGSCDGGPAAEWIPDLLLEPKNTIALTGYCAQESVGGQLLALATSSLSERARHTGSVSWPDRRRSVPIAKIAARIARLEGYSAHADQVGLVNWLLGSDPTCPHGPVAQAVFLQHGNDQDRTALHNAITERANALGTRIDVASPADSNRWIDLDAGQHGQFVRKDKAQILQEIAKLEAELAAVE